MTLRDAGSERVVTITEDAATYWIQTPDAGGPMAMPCDSERYDEHPAFATQSLESRVRLGDSTRFAAGYNFSATADPSLATTPVHRGFYTTITSVVDHLFGWGKQ